MGDSMQADNRGSALERFKAEAWPLLPALLRVATILTGDGHQAEYLVHETMMRAYRHIETFHGGTNMKAWLLTILRRVHIDLYRKEARRVESGSLGAMELVPAARSGDAANGQRAWSNPDELLGRFDDQAVVDALRSLPETMRWVLLLVDVEQMSVAEAGASLGVAEGTIKSRASRARATLRENLLPVARKRGWVAAPAGE